MPHNPGVIIVLIGFVLFAILETCLTIADHQKAKKLAIKQKAEAEYAEWKKEHGLGDR